MELKNRTAILSILTLFLFALIVGLFLSMAAEAQQFNSPVSPVSPIYMPIINKGGGVVIE